jgi:hypothetical protein
MISDLQKESSYLFELTQLLTKYAYGLQNLSTQVHLHEEHKLNYLLQMKQYRELQDKVKATMISIDRLIAKV